MKYKLKQKKVEPAFKPFSLTLTFNTEEEYVHFHDNVLKHIVYNAPMHNFVGDFFKMGRGRISEAEGKIEKE